MDYTNPGYSINLWCSPLCGYAPQTRGYPILQLEVRATCTHENLYPRDTSCSRPPPALDTPWHCRVGCQADESLPSGEQGASQVRKPSDTDNTGKARFPSAALPFKPSGFPPHPRVSRHRPLSLLLSLAALQSDWLTILLTHVFFVIGPSIPTKPQDR